ncbi:hypothetical protein [Alicyclobacillus ferrooxydans]|uniref:ABC transmembrane type-1 domain-containing protein n=1 Tax=Alicyclobacillus ferrooxydans TaxID=471514 RepID=A0A0P9EHN8_9BACL|nr:hypothetical protein [Alicyclobacillus ferrooxydans]KPV42180.1 hypothetical protein AN477_19280 [Alicyclobacillus ferrooxydans]
MNESRHRWWSTRAFIGILVIAGFLVMGLHPSLVTHYGPYQMDKIHLSDDTIPPFPVSRMHWFGTDENGVDIFTQIVYGIVPTLRDATIMVAFTLAAAVIIAVIQTLYKVRIMLVDRLSYLTSIFPPVLIMLLILEIQPVYFSHDSAYWYYAVIGVLELGRFIPIVDKDIRLIYQKPFIESAVVVGGSQWWIFRKHVLRWMWPYLAEYIPSQYARILAVMGELGYFGVVTKAQFLQSQNGISFTSTQLDLPTLLSLGGHHWFQVPDGVFFPTLTLCLMIIAFRLIATGAARVSMVERTEHWPMKDMPWWMRLLAPRNGHGRGGTHPAAVGK